MTSLRPLRRRVSAALCGSALAVSSFAIAPGAVADHDAIEDCPAIMPTSEVAAGQLATGYTVARGDTPEPFSVEVLGVLPNGVAPGRDMIVVDTSSPAIDAAGGIWFGMSGSPVYFEGKLMGALAFGLAFGPSSIAGLTPAEDINAVLNKPAASTGTARKVTLTPKIRSRIARSARVSSEEVGDLRILKTPFAISGVGSRGMDLIRKAVRREKLPLRPYAAGSASGAPAPADRPFEAGGNFVGAISYGDVTSAGVGTTTMVCDDRAVAFGHPFAFQGETTLGANLGNAITIVGSPFDSYKLATVEGGVGTVDQDRLAGIRALVGEMPALIPIRSSTTALSGTGARLGSTDVITSEAVPFLTFIHLFSNIDSVYDKIGAGSSQLQWTVRGTREDGEPWELERSNVYASEFDISFGSVFEILGQLFTLLENDFEDIEFTGVDVTVAVEDEVKQLSIVDILVSKDGGRFKDVRRVRVRPGQLLTLRVELEPSGTDDLETAELQIRVPRGLRRAGIIEVSGGGTDEDDFFCLFDPEACSSGGKKVDSLDGLIKALEDRPTNNQLLGRLRGGRRFSVKAQDTETLDRVVSGSKIIRLRVGR